MTKAIIKIGQQELTPDAHDQVTIRGFLYRSQDGKWILAQEPALKSCCIGSKKNVMEQVYINGFEPEITSKNVSEVQGKLIVDPQYDQDGILIQYYTLENGKILESDSISPLLMGGFLMAAVFVILFLSKLYRPAV